EVIINIARSEDEAATQAKTGKALIVEEGQSARDEDEAEDQLAEVLDEAALEARKSEEDEKEGEEEAAVKKAKGKRKPEAEAAEAEEGEEAPEKKKAKKPANAKKDSE